MTLLKREKELFLKIRPQYVDSPEMQEVARIFHLTPGLRKYKVKSELTEEAEEKLPRPLGDDTDLPEHAVRIADHDVPLQGCMCPRGTRADWCRAGDSRPGWNSLRLDAVTAGTFFVHAQKHRPHAAEVAVYYRGYWFYIAQDDVSSRALLAILEILFALQESDGKNVGPLLTLPLG